MSVVAAATRHTELNRRILLGWIRECEDSKGPMPSDEEIAGRFGFESVELARTLLADLADQGKVTVVYDRSGRTLALGLMQRQSPAASPRPVPPIRKPGHAADGLLSVDAGAAKIMGILNRPRTEPVLRIVEPVEAPVALAAPAVQSPPPSPAPRERAPYIRPTEAQRTARWGNRATQASIYCKAELVMAIEALARPDESLGQAARRLLTEAVMRPPAKKPRIKQHVAEAASLGGHDLHEFIGLLVELGFKEFQRQRGTVQ